VPVRRVHLRGLALVHALVLSAVAMSLAQAATIYSCVDSQGRRLTSDRPITECLDRSQDLRNNDGSVRARVPPSLTAEERAAAEDEQRHQMAADAARKDAVRHDRNLLTRYPDEAAHRHAREAVLDPLLQALRNADKRLAELERERLALADEAEFYKGKAVPNKLKTRIDDNRTSTDAQRAAMQTHLAERTRINQRYDDELARLKRLWSGAVPGSLGSAPGTAPAR
jgi:Domain of unknown function (DUF4124)